MKRLDVGKIIKAAILGLVSIAAISFFKNYSLLESFSFFTIETAVICILQEKQIFLPDKRRNKYCIVLAILFAISMVMNFAINVDGEPEYLFQTVKHLITSIAGIFGYTLLFYYIFQLLFILFSDDNFYICRNTFKFNCKRGLFTKPFWFAFIVLCIAYIPYIILSYPAVFLEDGITSLSQGFSGNITNHHPALYTIMLTEIVKAGFAITKSWNFAIFVYSLLQLLVTLAVLSFGIKILKDDFNVNYYVILLLLFYFIVNPRIANYMMMVAKDTLYAASVLLFLESVILIYRNQLNRKNGFLLFIASLGVISFRNEGIYVASISLIVLTIGNRKKIKLRRFFALMFCGLALLNSIYIGLMPIFGIEQGSKREMLSIPLQQTALCVKDHRDEITEHEEKVILAAFSDPDYGFENLDYIIYQNDPISKADRVKAAFCWDVTSPEAIEYYKVWFQMGFKYPFTYIKALILANYQYFDFETKFENISYKLGATSQNALSMMPPDFTYPSQLDDIRNFYEAAREKLFSISPFSVLNNAGTYTWTLIIWISILLYKKRYSTLQLAVIPVVIMLICFASPCNGFYCRYQFPLQMYLPFAIIAGSKLYNSQEKSV